MAGRVCRAGYTVGGAPLGSATGGCPRRGGDVYRADGRQQALALLAQRGPVIGGQGGQVGAGTGDPSHLPQAPHRVSHEMNDQLRQRGGSEYWPMNRR
jgi:hypothetical protein